MSAAELYWRLSCSAAPEFPSVMEEIDVDRALDALYEFDMRKVSEADVLSLPVVQKVIAQFLEHDKVGQ